jgi:hypothetical protein
MVSNSLAEIGCDSKLRVARRSSITCPSGRDAAATADSSNDVSFRLMVREGMNA